MENKNKVKSSKVDSLNKKPEKHTEQDSRLNKHISSFKDSILFQKQPLDVQYRLLKQREDLRLKREMSFRQLKSQLSYGDHKRDMFDLEEAYIKTYCPALSSCKNSFFSYFVPLNLKKDFFLVEDKCATLIQAAWRGYLARKSEPIKSLMKEIENRKMKKHLRCVNQL
jgi:hypothetical protein